MDSGFKGKNQTNEATSDPMDGLKMDITARGGLTKCRLQVFFTTKIKEIYKSTILITVL